MTEIQAKKRTILGKQTTMLRKEGVLPAVLYGEGLTTMPISVSSREFERVFRESGETSVLTLTVEGDRTYNVFIHDIATDPMTLSPIHADFYAVRMDKPIEAKVPLSFIGTSGAVASEGGILVKVLHELEVKALPGDMPHEIQVNLEAMKVIGDKIYVRDLTLPERVLSRVSADEVVALVEPPRSDAELEAITKVEEAAPTEVKTERELKAETKAETEESESAEGTK
jgi:large subunit ribosomal protein L25